ncbi:MAG TPA: abhydrolase domain-containing 18 [Blastocatellia bacterium]|nr:abhydrolase domain-containing 18 [Blastocatellia bacterium]
MLRRLIHSWEHKLARRDNNRVVRPFEWGSEFLDYSLPSLNGEQSRSNGNGHTERDRIFRFNDLAIAKSESFFGSQTVPEFSLDGEWLQFESVVRTPYAENNTVNCRYFPVPARGGVPDSSRAHEVKRARGRAVVVLPHWNAKAAEHVAVCELLNRAGLAAVRLSLPYHDKRMLPGFERADYMVSSNIGRTLQANRQAVLDTRSVVDWLISQGYEQVGILGTSLGSCIAFLTFIHDKRLRVGVYNHVSSYFGDVVWDGLTTKHVRHSLEMHLTRDEVRRAWLAISPNSYIDRLSGDTRRELLISARYDLSFTPALSRLLFEECDRQSVKLDRKKVLCGHYTLGRAPYKYYAGYLIVNYFRKHL